MALTFTKFQPFVENLAEGKFNFSSDATCTITVALCATATPPVNTNAVLADITQIDYTNLSTRVCAVATSEQTSGTYKLKLTDLTLTASGDVAAFQYIVLYDDDSTGDCLIGFFDYGSVITLHNTDDIVLDFDGTNGCISIV